MSGTHKVFAGRTKTVCGPHAAHVPGFGPCWARALT